MKLEGLHHATMITGDARRNAAFFAEVLGLRLVEQTVDFDQPGACHPCFGDERGAPGSILTWFEFGFTQHLGEPLRLPVQHQHPRAELERTLTPIDDPRAARRREPVA